MKGRAPKGLFWDGLPYTDIREAIEERMLTMDAVFNLTDEERELLKDKDLAVGFDIYEYQDLFSVFGSKLEDFDLYKKYKGILDIVADNIANEEPVKTQEEKEKMIKRLFLQNIGKRDSYRYTTEVPAEFKEEHQEFFLDENAPKELKDVFYNVGASILMSNKLEFSDLQKNPEYIPYLKGKDIRHCMGWGNDYEDFFDFCEDQDLAMDLGLKYGDYVRKLTFSKGTYDDKEAIVAEQIYWAIIHKMYDYNEEMPAYFKKKYPELFLDKNAPAELKQKYYTKKIKKKETNYYITSSGMEYASSDFEKKGLSFEWLKENKEYIEFLKGKDLRGALDGEYKRILGLCGNDVEEYLFIGIEYGDVLVHPQLRHRILKIENIYNDPNEPRRDLRYILDEEIGEAIKKRELLFYDDSLPLHLQYKYPEVFLLPEELDRIKGGFDSWDPEEELKTVKEKFYRRCISFTDLYQNDELKEIIKYKDIDRCMDFYKAGDFFRKFSEIFGGDVEKAYNLAINKYSQQLNSILYGYTASENINKVINFYKQAKFIPHPAVFNKLSEDMIRGFVLNKNLWAELMKIEEYTLNDEYIGSLFELALIMGVFETKEVVKNGKVTLHGVGEEGFEKLMSLINYVPEYFDELTTDELDYSFAMHGYSKRDEDYLDALVDRKIQIALSKEGLIDELRDGALTDYDMENASIPYKKDEDIYQKDSDGRYHYILDKNSNTKVQKLLKTVGIKKDRWLTPEEFALIESCNRDFILKAFIREEEGYRFNVSKQEEMYVIGGDLETTEMQSKANKKLFDYVRFLMEEYSMEEEALRLAANNDRSNIDLVLDNEKMEALLGAADWVSKRACDKYEECDLYKLRPECKKYYRFLLPNKLHQLFDGLNLEYSKAFRDFILENKYELINDWELIEFMGDFQYGVKDLSQDPDCANIKITPEVLIKALVPVENQYRKKKTGFEKGEELAAKFSFNQEYFDHAQKVWNEARRRGASSIPRVKGQDDKYSYEVLRLDDAEGIYIGNLTDCCQKLAGAGETSMLHSMTEKNGRVFVVRDENKRIIAQSWLWRNGNVICFDNVEVPDRAMSSENQKAVYRILRSVAKELCDKDREIVEKYVRERGISQKKAEQLKAMKVTVGKGHNDIYEIAYNEVDELEDKEIRRPLESAKEYKGIARRDRLYIGDSNHQVILYEVDKYVPSDSMLAIHRDENTEINYEEIKYKDLKMMKSIIKEVEGECTFETKEDLAKQYDIEPDELKYVQGTDWFMLYSESNDEIKVRKMLKSSTSGILPKSIREQREAINILMQKGKSISMEADNERICEAAKSMIRHMQKRYTMKVADEGRRISVSNIQMR